MTRLRACVFFLASTAALVGCGSEGNQPSSGEGDLVSLDCDAGAGPGTGSGTDPGTGTGSGEPSAGSGTGGTGASTMVGTGGGSTPLPGVPGDPVRRPRPVVVTAAPRPASHLSSSVMMLGDWDTRHDGNIKDADGHVLSRCEQMVDIAAGLGNDTVNFVPTHGFMAEALRDADGQQQKDKYGNPKWRASDYCYKYGGTDPATGKTICRRFDAAEDMGDAVSRIRDDWAACFQRAFEYDMSVSLVPHLDDGRELGVWRNSVAFDPMEKLGPSGSKALSYYDIMLEPLAQAIVTAATRAKATKAKIYFALQGEMGATVFYAPQGHQQAAAKVREILAPLKDALQVDAQIGVSVNFNTITGGQAENPSGELKSQLQSLFHALDFVGVSSYGSVLARPADEDLDGALTSLASELGSFGVDLAGLVREGKKLHFSELGLGGGDGTGAMASTPDVAASKPWAGMFGPYSADQDPWNETTRPQFARLQRRFYTAVLDYLARPHDPATLTGSHWYVDQAFIWNLSSWDVQGIYPESTTKDGTGSYYRNDVVCRIFQHNTGSAECLVRPPLPWLVLPGVI